MGDVTWLPAPGAPFYEISSDGRVRSQGRWVRYPNGSNRWFPGCERKSFAVKGYLHLTLNVNRAKKNFYIHLLVCEAFHGSRPSPVHEARHLNGDPLDNRADNLAWGTKKENAQDSIRHGTNNQANKTHCKREHLLPADRRCRECARMRSREAYYRNQVMFSVRFRERLEKKAREEGRTLRRCARGSMYLTLESDT